MIAQWSSKFLVKTNNLLKVAKSYRYNSIFTILKTNVNDEKNE